MASNSEVVCRECDMPMARTGVSAIEGSIKIRFECTSINCNNYSEKVVKQDD
jgi:hypothetical protein